MAPALYAASIYMTMHRLLTRVKAESYSLIRVTWSTKIFVAGDILSFLIVAAGGTLSTDDDFDKDTAKWIVFLGLVVQKLIYAIFFCTLIVFHRRINKRPTDVSLDPRAKMREVIRMLYIFTFFMLARGVFRIVEYLMGFDSYLFTNEWCLLVFDSSMMFLAMVTYAWWNPGHLVVKKNLGQKDYYMSRQNGYESGDSMVPPPLPQRNGISHNPKYHGRNGNYV